MNHFQAVILEHHVEVAIRTYDLRLNCAAHAGERMPLDVALFDAKGEALDRKRR